MAESSTGRRPSLTTALLGALLLGAIGLSWVVAAAGGDQDRRRRVDSAHEQRWRLAERAAARAAPHLERDEDDALARLVATAADLGRCRIVVFDTDGLIRQDSAPRAGSIEQVPETVDEAVRRERGDGRFAVVTPAIGATGRVGQVWVGYELDPQLRQAQLSLVLFGVAFLASLSLVGLAYWIAQTWASRVRSLVERVRRAQANHGFVASGSTALVPQPAPNGTAALTELETALDDLVAHADDRVTGFEDAFVSLANQIVRLLEREGLTPNGHGLRTARYAQLLADRIGLEDEDRRTLDLAARLLDVGKSGVRPSALRKADGLDDDERESLRQYPLRGAKLLDAMPSLAPVALAIRHHHEKYDGSGFPEALRGERIPLASRILAIADAYDLLTAKSVFGQPLSWPDALDRLHEDRGEHFDPHLLDIFEGEIRRGSPPAAADAPVVISRSGVVPYKFGEEIYRDVIDGGADVAGEDPFDFDIESDVILAVADEELELFDDEDDSCADT